MATGNSPRDYGAKNGKSKTAPVWRKNTISSEPYTWGDIDAVDIRRAVDAITRAGGAIMLSVTADGGAYSIVVLYRDEKIKEYPHGTAACTATLNELVEYFTDQLV